MTIYHKVHHDLMTVLECVWNVIAHTQKPDFVFRRNGRVHLNRRGRQFSQLLAAEVCASAVVMLDTPSSEVVWEYWLPTPFASFPFTSPPVRHRVPSGFKRTLPQKPWLCWHSTPAVLLVYPFFNAICLLSLAVLYLAPLSTFFPHVFSVLCFTLSSTSWNFMVDFLFSLP